MIMKLEKYILRSLKVLKQHFITSILCIKLFIIFYNSEATYSMIFLKFILVKDFLALNSLYIFF